MKKFLFLLASTTIITFASSTAALANEQNNISTESQYQEIDIYSAELDLEMIELEKIIEQLNIDITEPNNANVLENNLTNLAKILNSVKEPESFIEANKNIQSPETQLAKKIDILEAETQKLGTEIKTLRKGIEARTASTEELSKKISQLNINYSKPFMSTYEELFEKASNENPQLLAEAAKMLTIFEEYNKQNGKTFFEQPFPTN